MSAKILDGKKIAEEMKSEIKTEIFELSKKGIRPGLAVVLVGNDPASKIYVNSKKKACEVVGIVSRVLELPENALEQELLKIIGELNGDSNVHGILVQLPVPKHIDEKKILNAISKEKDVDCFHPENFGEMALDARSARFKPCTPQGIMELFDRYNVEIEGKNCVVVGRSNIVGKPMALLLLQKGGTVTVCHSKTRDLKKHCQKADILVSAVGKERFVSAEMVKAGAVVVDVGINRNGEGKIIGDVDFEKVKEVAEVITPVPGGVGPMTIAQLLKNTLIAAKSSVRGEGS